MVIRRHIEVSEHDPTVSLLEAPSADYSTCASNSSSEIIMDLCVRYRYQESAGKGPVVGGGSVEPFCFQLEATLGDVTENVLYRLGAHRIHDPTTEHTFTHDFPSVRSDAIAKIGDQLTHDPQFGMDRPRTLRMESI
jgi:hypothetical protein